ncbi:MAG TPA: MFS transporter [Thermoleophilaceae bacterium]
MNTRQRRRVALLVAGCFFMETLDGTIVTTAAPKIASALHVASTATGLVITAYLLTLAVLIPLSGWLTVRFGVRPVFLAAIVIFTGASLACAFATSLGELVAFRILQGAGGAMMVPVGRLMVISGTPKDQIIRTMSIVVWPGLIAPVIAPLLGGVITTYAGWRWLFLVNIPLGIVAFAIAWRLITSAADAGTPPPLDRVGVVLTCTALAGVTYTAHLLSEPSEPWGPVAAYGIGSALLLIVACVHLLRTPEPLVNLRTLRVPTFGASIAGSSLFWITVGAAPFLLPLLFQNVFHWSAVKSGALVLFLFVGNVGAKTGTTYLLNRFGFRRALVAATVGLAATMVGCAFFSAGTPLVVIVAIVLLSGVARSVGLTAYNTMTFADVPPEQVRDANTLAATSAQLCAGLGVAAATVALRVGVPAGKLLPGQSTPASAYTVAFLLLALVAVLPAAGALRLHATAGDTLRTLTPREERS